MLFYLIGFVITFPIAVLIFKIFFKITSAWDRSPTCLVGKTVIVTGANSGIGFYAAQDFAKRGAKVILACRNQKRAEEAKLKIIEVTGNSKVFVKIIDLTSLASVRAFAEDINKTEERLDILVNNAGIAGFEHCLTSDGLSFIMQANHFGHFLLTNLLIKLLKRSGPSRIINVASAAAHFAKLDINNLNSPAVAYFTKTVDYSNTKLCNILFTNELTRRLNGCKVEAYSLHPGCVQTNIFDNVPLPYRNFIYAAAKIFHKSSEEGAQTIIYASVSKDLIGRSGEYLEECKKAKLPKTAEDKELAKQLWEKSADFVKLTAEECQLLSNVEKYF